MISAGAIAGGLVSGEIPSGTQQGTTGTPPGTTPGAVGPGYNTSNNHGYNVNMNLNGMSQGAQDWVGYGFAFNGAVDAVDGMLGNIFSFALAGKQMDLQGKYLDYSKEIASEKMQLSKELGGRYADLSETVNSSKNETSIRLLEIHEAGETERTQIHEDAKTKRVTTKGIDVNEAMSNRTSYQYGLPTFK